MPLKKGIIGRTYQIKKVETSDDALNHFLLTLGCYEGQQITLVSNLKHNCIVFIKDARYSIDNHLANAIIV